MQAYHPSNHPANQQYYPQAQYAPQPVYYAPYPQSYAPGYPPQAAQPFPGVYPVDRGYDEDGHPKQRYPTTPGIRPKHLLSRSHSTQVPRSKHGQPKSIMKKTHDRSASMNVIPPTSEPPISRSRSNSNARPSSRPSSRGHESTSRPPSRTPSQTRQRANSSTRPQFDSIPAFIPDHVFLSLHGTNEIRAENIAYQSLVEDLRENFLPMWPHGVSSEDSREQRWRAQFSGNPWTSTGSDGIFARRMICRLFAVFANQGYSYLSTVNTSSASSRLIFTATESEPMAAFFSISMSPSGDKISVLDGPPWLVNNLGRSIRAVFPRKIASDRSTEDGVCIIELKKGLVGSGSDVDKSLFAAYILKYFTSQGFKLSGSLPMGRSRSPLSLGAKKEVWIFRGSLRRPESSNGHE